MKLPASPALSQNTKPITVPVKVERSLTSASRVNPKPYAQLPAIRTVNRPGEYSLSQVSPTSTWMTGSADEYPEGNIVYQSLQAPKLLRGGEQLFSIIIIGLAGICLYMAYFQWSLWWLLPGFWLGGPCQWFLQTLAKHDPEYVAILIEWWKHPAVREAE